ncbi:hypothetical protein [Polynucleobacter sp. UK-Kesae-W10]|uniref:hypothetical protein n=1 Tax=Polynucleobacter sp. UK-Kesae-W10 TaxID=1819738 RepID=UPI001C0B0EC4|nr:hypothetical protein [Polynucleobacter sp. UK-Kesae-W10]MBU3577552.1 hypothetical protein [Polynucleobacter sp. UK-Kesae-W10]
MFDRTTIHQSGSIRADVTITEKRAPTDESVKLLREMEAKSKAEVIKAITLNDNRFDGVIHTMVEHLTGDHLLRFVYSVNGKKLTTDFRIDMFDASPETWIPKFVNAVAKDLAMSVLAAPMAAAVKRDPSLLKGARP